MPNPSDKKKSGTTAAAAAAAANDDSNRPWYTKLDLIRRGERAPTPWGTLTFIGLRLIDIPLQHALLSPRGLGGSLLARFGVPLALTASTPTTAAVLRTGIPLVDALGHPTGALLLAFACGSAAKQIYWQTVLSFESFPAGAAAAVALLNTVLNAANGLLYLASGTSSLFSGPLVTLPFSLPFLSNPAARPGTAVVPLSTLAGVLLYVGGLALETVSEAQRKRFKQDPRNAGRVCKEGVWRWARHVNYLGYSLWRGGYTMVATGWAGGLAMAGWQMYDLSHRAAGALDAYCEKKYADQWTEFKREVPYKILPGVY